MPPTTDIDQPQALGRLISIAEVAERLGVEVRHVRRLVHERRIPFIKWGHLLRFDAAEVHGSTATASILAALGSAADRRPPHSARTMTAALGPRRSLGLEAP